MPENARSIKDKLTITGRIVLETGLHIGTSGDYSPIGAVDSIVVRDPVTRCPIIPGSSIKGKMRSLLAASEAITPWMPKVDEESDALQHLFGSGGKNIRRSRLQFRDLFMTEKSVALLEKADTDLYLTEVKFENYIDRITSVANPRQLERVPAGAEFAFVLTYVVEDPDQIDGDIELLAKGIRLLQSDYLGMGGSRGNGRVRFEDLDLRSELDYVQDLDRSREVLRRAVQS